MNHPRAVSFAVCALLSAPACGSTENSTKGLGMATVIDLNNVKTNPAGYEWFDFRPNVKKLILSGQAETEHVAILWYTIAEGAVGLHYHAKTESVYVIDGTQTDAKGVYGTDTVYFNPPGSGHEITKSSGFFLLSYAAPPDFMKTNLIGEYTPVRIDTAAADLTSRYAFEQKKPGVRVYTPPLDTTGGLRAELIEITSAEEHLFTGNYLLVLKGSCAVEGVPLGKDLLVVPKTVVPQPYRVKGTTTGVCLALGVSF